PHPGRGGGTRGGWGPHPRWPRRPAGSPPPRRDAAGGTGGLAPARGRSCGRQRLRARPPDPRAGRGWRRYGPLTGPSRVPPWGTGSTTRAAALGTAPTLRGRAWWSARVG